MKYLFSAFFLWIIVISCDPPRFCTEPKCMYSDVNVEIQGILSGKLDSIIHIGDTIRFYMKIPDTMITNYGNIVFGQLLQNSFFAINCGGGDTLIGSGVGAFNGNVHIVNPILIKYGTMVNGVKTWNYTTREYECLFIPTEKGRNVINVYGGRLEMTANDGRSWLVNPAIKLNCPKRYDQYLSWMDSSMRDEAYRITSQKIGWYCFEVK
jgi:hypothetical protein